MLAPRRLRYSHLSVAVLFLAGLLVASSLGARAQENSAAGSSTTMKAEPAKESREAGGEDEQEQFKHSPSVKWVAKYAGLSLEHAYWLCVLLNFGVIAGTILYLSKKNLPGVFRDRTSFHSAGDAGGAKGQRGG